MKKLIWWILFFFIGSLMSSTFSYFFAVHNALRSENFLNQHTPIVLKTTKDEVIAYISNKSKEVGIDSVKPLDIAYCESRYDPLTQNPNSSAKGVFQFTKLTWGRYCSGNVLDARNNIDCFFKIWPYHKAWWACK